MKMSAFKDSRLLVHLMFKSWLILATQLLNLFYNALLFLDILDPLARNTHTLYTLADGSINPWGGVCVEEVFDLVSFVITRELHNITC